MRLQCAWLACVFGAVFPGGHGEALADGKEAKNWHTVTQDDRVSVSVERALYERSGQDLILVQIRVTNRTTRKIGVDLDYWNVIYPNPWGVHALDHRVIIDEERHTPATPTGERKTQMINAFTGNQLTFVPPNQSVRYFRDFNGPAGRSEVERQSKQGSFLIVSMDGQLFYTDGQSVHDVHCEWSGDFGSENTDVVLKLPIAWKQLPKTAIVVEDTQSQ